MSPHRVTLAEFSTGIIRKADTPRNRFKRGRPGLEYQVFPSEQEALQFKDKTLTEFPELAAFVRPEDGTDGEYFYSWKDNQIVGEKVVRREPKAEPAPPGG